jgi:periplasmic protein TonB
MAMATHTSPHPTPEFLFQSLTGTLHADTAGRNGATLAVSATVHAVLVAAIVLVPLFLYDAIPEPSESILKAFFVAPVEIAPAPPPPPPPAPALRSAIKAPVPIPSLAPTAFVAPIEAPEGIRQQEGIELGFGVEGGVPGGVEGGVPGGVLGGIVGGAMALTPPPPSKIVRVGGNIVAPKIVKKVEPEYPDLAKASRLGAVIIMEAQVDTQGVVKSVNVLRGHPLFDEAATTAVKQWRYRPLLLNGEPTAFIVTVTLIFNIQTGNI